MISDYNNPYFYQTPPKANNPFLGYQYPAEDHEMKYGIGAYPEQACDYPPAPCFPYPPAYVPVPSPNFPPEQCKMDYVDPPIVKYEYQEPEENFISIDELQYNPTLLKMILPEKIEPEKIKQQIKAEKSRRQGLAQKQATPVKIKAEPPDDWPPISENTVNERIQAEAVASKSPEIPVLSAVKLERDGSPSNTFPEQFPGQVQIKTEPQYKFSILDESDEEIDENEQGVEFNWMDLEEQEKHEFECCYCAKKVSSSYNLRRHMMIHTGEFGIKTNFNCISSHVDLIDFLSKNCVLEIPEPCSNVLVIVLRLCIFTLAYHFQSDVQITNTKLFIKQLKTKKTRHLGIFCFQDS